MNKFKVKADFQLNLAQKKAVQRLSQNYHRGVKHQVLLGVTGSGKTFVMAKLIEKLQIPALVISHNKTLAAQLYQEYRDFMPGHAISFFVSYYDYYQPEAYLPSTDTYIEKDADVNELIDKLRLETTYNLLTRRDVVVVASVSTIYNIGSPQQYKKHVFSLKLGQKIDRQKIINRLLDLQYERSEFRFNRGTFRIRGGSIDLFPAYQDEAIRLDTTSNQLTNVSLINPVEGTTLDNHLENVYIFPSKHFLTDPNIKKSIFDQIVKDTKKQVNNFKLKGKELEAHRLKQKVAYDLEMINEFGYVKGIENYSRYFDGRKVGEPPFTLLDYFTDAYKNKWLMIIDESHITFPQIRGMYHGDLSRKKTLIEYGFRLPSALDNRPLNFEEFMRKIPNFIATSATPADWEKSMAVNQTGIVELLTRPTGIPDPKVEIRPTKSQVADLIFEISKQIKKGQRTLVTTLTKQSAEDLSGYLIEKGFKVHHLHSDIDTLERTDLLEKLRTGDYDVLVGINLLREGLDLPEVSLVAILDADKEGFLRSEVSLIQTMGRAARHRDGKVILYADTHTASINKALEEVNRRREYQLNINRKYGIIPTSITKPIRSKLIIDEKLQNLEGILEKDQNLFITLKELNRLSLTPLDKKRFTNKLRKEMLIAAKNLDFELAAEIRDLIKRLTE